MKIEHKPFLETIIMKQLRTEYIGSAYMIYWFATHWYGYPLTLWKENTGFQYLIITVPILFITGMAIYLGWILSQKGHPQLGKTIFLLFVLLVSLYYDVSKILIL